MKPNCIHIVLGALGAAWPLGAVPGVMQSGSSESHAPT